MPPSQPTPQAITAAVAEVRRQTGNNTWRYQNGRWIVTVRLPNGRLFSRPADAAESAQFNSILRYYQTVHPPAPPPGRPTIRQRLFGMGATGSLNPIGSARAAIASRGLVGATGGAIGNVAGALGAGLSVVGKIGGMITGVIGGVLRTIGGALKLAGGLLVGALAAGVGALFLFTRTVSSLAREMIVVARQITSIRNNTGASVGAAQSGYNSLTAAGMSGEGASAFLGSDAMRGGMGKQRAAAWGLGDPFGPNFAADFARKSQSMGIFQRRAMADSLSGGSASPELLQLQNTRPEVIEREQKIQSGFRGSLGVTPEAIRRISDELPLLQGRFAGFVQTIKMRFISEMLPSMERGINMAADFFQKNSGNIASAIRAGTRWLYVSFPDVLLSAAEIGLSALEMIANGFFSLGDAVANGLRAIGQGQSGLYSFFEFLGNVIDSLIAGAVAFGLTNTQTDIKGDMENWRNSSTPEKWADNVQGFTDAGRRGFKNVDTLAHGSLDEARTRLGTVEQRDADFASAMKELTVATRGGNKDIVNAINKVEEAAKAGGVGGVLNGIGAAIGKTAYLDATR